jgi:hypothetical protein
LWKGDSTFGKRLGFLTGDGNTVGIQIAETADVHSFSQTAYDKGPQAALAVWRALPLGQQAAIIGRVTAPRRAQPWKPPSAADAPWKNWKMTPCRAFAKNLTYKARINIPLDYSSRFRYPACSGV